MKQELVEERNESPSNTPYFSGRALSLKLKSKRLEATRQRLLETKWAGHCGISCKVCHQQEMLVGSISETIFRLYHEWMDDIGDNPKSRLDRYLMRRSDDKPGLLESNLDPNLVNLCREANYWQNLGFQIPIYVQMIYDKWDTLQFVSESVLMLVRAYNRILDGIIPHCLSSLTVLFFCDVILPFVFVSVCVLLKLYRPKRRLFFGAILGILTKKFTLDYASSLGILI